MQKRLLLNEKMLDITLMRLCQQLIENHDQFSSSVIIGLQPRGTFLADRIAKLLHERSGINVQFGYLDITFFRDDFRRREVPLKANETRINFMIENKRVILIDDVLYTGRSVRSALDAMTAFGRPASVELLVLVDRKYSRDLPIQANYIGKAVNTVESQRVLVEWREAGHKTDNVWLIEKHD